MSIKVTPVNEGLDKSRAADLIVALNETAAQHGFLLGIQVEQGEWNEFVSMRLRFIQTTEIKLPVPDQEVVRREVAAELAKSPPSPLEQIVAEAERILKQAEALASLSGYGDKPPRPAKGLERD